VRIYAALADTRQCRNSVAVGYKNILVSFALDPGHRYFAHFDYPLRRMLDSGAHSVWSSGKTMDLNEYITWVREEVESTTDPTRVVSLDVIPGERGRIATPKERALAVGKSVENAELLRAEGFRVIEVFHLYEPIGVWEAMIERRRDGEVLGLAGLGQPYTGRQIKQAHGDAAFSVLKSMCGWDALPPVHGFGVASTLTTRYPLASIDATTFASGERWGRIPDGVIGSRNEEGERRATRFESGRLLTQINYWNQWRRLERDMTGLWRSRGVRFLPEKGALIDRDEVAV
jgi:hypothetical protein